MSCICSKNFTGSATDLYNSIKTQIEANGGTITGDDTAGNFSVLTPIGTVGGSYTITGTQISIQISKKPVLVGCTAICNYIDDHLA